jgi:hypothetical protein
VAHEDIKHDAMLDVTGTILVLMCVDWAMGRTTDESQFHFQISIRGRDFFLLQMIQSGSVVHPSS